MREKSTAASLSEFHPNTVLVTGGAGFIGSNLVRWLLQTEPSIRVVTLDLLTYAGNLESLDDVIRSHGSHGDGRHFFVHGDIRDAELVATLLRGSLLETGSGRRIPAIDAILHLAAESHVDRSILGPAAFVSTNVQGTLALLDGMREELTARPRPFRFINVSTDEVYGSLGPDDAPFTEKHPLSPNSPYAASKAGADCLVRAYAKTFALPCITTRCSNNYGPYQFPEKLIPLMITRAISGEALPIYGDGLQIRDWLHVEDHASGIWAVCRHGAVGAVYNLGGDAEWSNIALVRLLISELGQPDSLIRYVPDRLGHDRRYAMDATRIRTELLWKPRRDFMTGIRETVAWYVKNRAWWARVQSEAYRATNTLYLGPERTLSTVARPD